MNGIIKTYPEVAIKEFLGDISYTGSALKTKAGKEPNPGGGDIRRAIMEYCILPMSRAVTKSQAVRIEPNLFQALNI